MGRTQQAAQLSEREENQSGERLEGNFRDGKWSYGVARPTSESTGGLISRQGLLTRARARSGAALKKAIQAVLSDIEFELQSETAERTRPRV
jgi:hypothetical protein